MNPLLLLGLVVVAAGVLLSVFDKDKGEPEPGTTDEQRAAVKLKAAEKRAANKATADAKLISDAAAIAAKKDADAAQVAAVTKAKEDAAALAIIPKGETD